MPAAETGVGGPGRVLEAALDVFSRRGFRGGSLNEIAADSGYSRAGLLHHFPSKEAVLIALLEQRDVVLGVTEAVVDGDLTLVELADRFERDIDAVLARRDLVLLAHVMAAEAGGDAHPASAWVRERRRRLREGIALAARRSLERRELAAGSDPAAVAALVLAAVEGLESQWLVDPEGVDPAAVLATLRVLLLPGTAT